MPPLESHSHPTERNKVSDQSSEASSHLHQDSQPTHDFKISDMRSNTADAHLPGLELTNHRKESEHGHGRHENAHDVGQAGTTSGDTTVAAAPPTDSAPASAANPTDTTNPVSAANPAAPGDASAATASQTAVGDSAPATTNPVTAANPADTTTAAVGDTTSTTPSTTADSTSAQNGVLFGIDGHPADWGGTYANFSPQQTIDSVASMGLKAYQVDANTGDTALMQQLIAAGQKDGVKVDINIGGNPADFSDAQTAYNQSYADAKAIGSALGDAPGYYQLTNEMDQYAMSSPQNLQIAMSEYKGLYDGLKSVVPDATTVLNTTNGPTGIEMLNAFQQGGANWDVTGFHTYTPDGNVSANYGTSLTQIEGLGKPVAITEFNGQPNGSQGPSAMANDASVLTTSMDQIRALQQQGQPIIQANLYELLNQPEIAGSEGQFGVLSANMTGTQLSAAVSADTAAYGAG